MNQRSRELIVLVAITGVIVAFANRQHDPGSIFHGTSHGTASAADAPSATQIPVMLPFPERMRYKVSGKIDLCLPGTRISEGIYGVCDANDSLLRAYGIAVTRSGGNPSSRYNWKINADNGASDWYFKNRGAPITDLGDNHYVKLIQTAKSHGATTYQTIPMLGWVAKDNTSYSFPVNKFGPQQQVEPNHPDVGDGVRADRKQLLKADPNDTSIAVGPDFVADAVAFAVDRAGRAQSGGVKYWALDNEPMLWHKTHRDVRPEPLGYDELWELTVKYAEAIKKADPTAKVAGFCSWGWTDLFYSSKDEGSDKYASQPDYRAHERMPLAEWYISRCAEYKCKTGRPLIDVFDFHWYPQAEVKGQSPYSGKGMDVSLNELRLRSTRDLWDPNYVQESWIRSSDRRPTQVIRRIRGWIEKYDPGLGLCVGEYNFGGGDNITGGLAQAEVFGILAREKVDLAFIWHTPEGTQNLAWQLFRNYDGHGSRFGDELLTTTCTDDDLAVFAARRKDGAVTIVAVNKNLGGECEFKLGATGLKGQMHVWRFDSAAGRLAAVPGESIAVDGSIKLTLPAASASMLVIK
jgi:Glycoside hydrolase family 44